MVKSLLTSLCLREVEATLRGDSLRELPLFGKWFDRAHHPELVEGEGRGEIFESLSMKRKRPSHLIFICVCNRLRSAFSEFLFPKIMGEKDARLDGRVKVSSAGFIPQKLRDHLARVPVKFPDPFYNRPMAEMTRATLFKKGIIVPEEWRSKELTSEMLEDADLLITALPEQKEELIRLFPKFQEKIFTIREMSQWDGYLFFEDFTVPPMDDTFWDYVDGNPEYVSKVISLTEEMLLRAYPNILKRLGLN